MDYLPPINPNNKLFNVSNFNYQDSFLTYYIGDSRYVRLSAPNVYYGLNTFNGTSIFNGNVNLNGNLVTGGVTLSPYNISQLNNLDINIKSKFTSLDATNATEDTNISVLQTQCTDLTHSGTTNTFANNLNIAGTTTSATLAVVNSTVNNSFSVGSNVAIGGSIACQNILSSGTLTIKNIQCQNITCANINAGNQTGIYLYCNSLTIPIIKSIPNTTIMYTNLNLSNLMGTNGANSSILLYPTYGIQFLNNSKVIFDLTNSGTDLLYSPIVFNQSLVCTSIQIYN